MKNHNDNACCSIAQFDPEVIWKAADASKFANALSKKNSELEFYAADAKLFLKCPYCGEFTPGLV